jgi:hypothetical protein
MMHRATLIAVLAVLLGAGSGSLAMAEQFRVENRVFLGDEKKPCSVSTTIFLDNVVYDYLAEPAEITIFDKDHGRFLLLDTSRRVKTEVTTAQVQDFTERLKQWALAQPNAYLKSLVEPDLEEQYNEDEGEFVFSSPSITYRLLTTAVDRPGISHQYREFSDWYGQLNALLNPGSQPPFARLVVNAALDARRRFPREVHLTFRSRDSLLSKRVTLRSEHERIDHLVQSDRDRITQTDQFIAIFTPVKFSEYRKK